MIAARRCTTLVVFLFLLVQICAAAAINPMTLQAGMRGLTLTVGEHTEANASFVATGSALSAPSEISDEAGLPHSGGFLWAVSSQTIDVHATVQRVSWRAAEPGEFADSIIERVRVEDLPVVAVSRVLSARGTKLASVSIHGLQFDAETQTLRVCDELEFSLEYVRGSQSVTDERLLSATFQDVLRGVVANLDDVEPVAVHRPEAYLVITTPGYLGNALNDFVQWKQQKGHSVTVATTTETGAQNSQILEYIRDAYNTWAEPPVFVQLIGDVDGTNPMPGWILEGFHTATIVSDHPYTLLEDGDDWIPDVFIGRLSVDSPTELQTVVNKIVGYERDPFEPDGAWRSRMLITGVRSGPGFYPTYNSAWPTLQWIGREFMESGYTSVDSVPFPGGNAQAINTRINNGVSYVAYRGFGSPHDWAFPPYDNSNITQLSNGQKLPLITSIVCGGGAFDSDVDPCFGELWLRSGSPSTPKGAIAFIGPSELDTKTRWNNTNIAAIYQGILYENVNSLGAAMLRGKMELIRQFPSYVDNLSSDADRSPWFYFHCYNLLGDPGLNHFVGPVRDLTATVPSSLPLGTPSIDILVEESANALSDVWGTVRRDSVVIGRAIGANNGHIVLDLPQDAAGVYEITLTKPRHEPHVSTLTLGVQGVYLGSSLEQIVDDGSNGSSGNGNGVANPGETIAMSIRLRNYGTQLFNGGTLSAVSPDEYLTATGGPATIPSIAGGQESSLLYMTFSVSQNATDGHMNRIQWDIPQGGYSWTSSISLSAPLIFITPEPLVENGFSLLVQNTGHDELANAQLTLRSLDPRFTLVDSIGQSNLNLIPGQEADGGTFIGITNGSFYPGDWFNCELHVVSARFVTVIPLRVAVGVLEDGDPTAPDEYGYRAFQDSDTEYEEAPQYAWVEIDPTRGGAGTVFSLPDSGPGHDTTRSMNLPFNFTFYGTERTQISICSNGFISFDGTRESYLRNYRLPAVASPDNMIAAFWDDLSLPADGRVCTYHDAQGGRFIIEWSHLQNEYSSQPEETFQIILYDTECWPTRTGDGDILIQWQQFNNVDSWDNYATIGLQDKDAGHHLLIGYANELQPGLSTIRSGQSLLFTTGRPTTGAYVTYAGNVIDDDNDGGSFGNNDGIAQNGETVQMSLQLQNTGEGSSPAFSGTLVSADNRIIVLDSQVSFPDLGPGEAAASAPVRIQISTTAPNGLVASLLLTLSGGAAPCVVVATLTVAGPSLGGLTPVMNDDATPPSIGNGNSEPNPRETLEFFPRVANSGGNVAAGVTATLRRVANDITILDSTVTFGDISINQELLATEPFVLRINNGVANGQTVQLRIVYRDQYGSTWSQNTSFLVVEPFLSIGTARISDPVPGGNNDGYVVGGESAEIYPSVENSGLGAASNVVMNVVCLDTTVTVSNTTQTVGTVSGGSSREPALPILMTVHPGQPEPRNVLLTVTITADGNISETKSIAVLIGIARFYADFEVDADRWSLFGRHSLWHTQTREYDSPTHAYYCGLEGPRRYDGGAEEYLRSPAFTFTGHGTLVYSTRYLTAGVGDVCKVQLQIGSSTYYILEQYWGDQDEWQEHRLSLADYPASESARIRFWFGSDSQTDDEGWYIDNVLIVDEDLSIEDVPGTVVPDQFTLEQNYPNPFNSTTTIRYNLPRQSHVSIALFDIEGRRVATLVEGNRKAGAHSVQWQPLSLGSGLYFVRLDAGGDVSLTRKIVYVK